MKQRVFWVAPDLDDWRVFRLDVGQSSEGVFESREEAVAWACRVAQRRAPCEVRVQDGVGAVQEQYRFPSVA